jgi:hypothetical protein
MSRGIQAFKERDLTKALNGARNAGFTVLRFEVDRSGKISVVIAGKAPEADLLDEEGRRIMVHPRQAAVGA